MKAKTLELRDRHTFIPVLGVDINPDSQEQRYLMRRLGYPCDGVPNVILTRLEGEGQATNDPHAWNDARTFPVAHNWIIDHWNELKDGDVVDVEFILGETLRPKISEQFEDDSDESFGEGSSADPGSGQACQDTGKSSPHLSAKELADGYEKQGYIDLSFDSDKEELAFVIAVLRGVP